MKLSAQEEYGLRCLLQVARQPAGRSVTIPEIAEAEGVSPHNVAKYLSTLRRSGIVASERGHSARIRIIAVRFGQHPVAVNVTCARQQQRVSVVTIEIAQGHAILILIEGR